MHNCDRYLKRAIESLIEQSLSEENYEIIVIYAELYYHDSASGASKGLTLDKLDCM